MMKLFHKIINIGVTGNTFEDEDIRLLNTISLIAIGVILSYVPVSTWRQVVEGGDYYIIAISAFCSALFS